MECQKTIPFLLLTREVIKKSRLLQDSDEKTRFKIIKTGKTDRVVVRLETEWGFDESV